MLAPGTHLGPYEILAPIGKGGMGEVFKARDTRLDRIVAIKVSKAAFSERFEREARAVAALNHPHICTLHDVGPNYLVMEFVEGEPLKGPLPLETAIEYAGQILEALDHAHRKRITHRDLKPANILLTKRGIKLLDFGLAKQKPEPLKETDETLSMALSKPLTQEGQILGTLQYMSPEQLHGQEADSRSDLFAFGCVLYEILTGKRAFPGSTAASVIAAILERPAPSVADIAPPSLDLVLKRCLEKDPDRRWQNPLDLKSALELSVAIPTQAPAPPPPTTNAKGRNIWMAVAAVTTIAAIALGFIALRHTAEPPSRLLKLSLDLPPGLELDTSPPAMAPDASAVVFSAKKDGKVELWLRTLDSLDPRPIRGTDNGIFPFWSPDSKWIGFFAESKLQKIEVSGGTPVTLAPAAESARGGAWTDDGFILYAPNSRSPIYRVSAAGGEAKPITTFRDGESSHRFPWVLPDGRHFLYSTTPGTIRRIYWADTQSDQAQRIIDSTDGNVEFAAGNLLLYRDGALFAQPFDPSTGKLHGEARPLQDNVSLVAGNGQIRFGVSRNATGLVYIQSGGGDRQLTWMDRTGKVLGVEGKPGLFFTAALSPDGQSIAYAMVSNGPTPQSDLWIYRRTEGVAQRFTLGGSGYFPVWSPDGNSIAYVDQPLSSSSRVRRIVVKSLTGETQTIDDTALESNATKSLRDWSRDGRYLMVETGNNPKTVNDIYYIDLKGEKKLIPFAVAPDSQASPRLSPNGHWLAYQSNESGLNQIMIQSFPTGTTRLQVSNDTGLAPNWSRDGKELYFFTAQRKLVALRVKGAAPGDSSNFQVGAKEELFEVPSDSYDVANDGRFLFLRPVAQETAGRMHVLLNWDAALPK